MSNVFEGGLSVNSPSPYFSGSFVEMGNSLNSDRNFAVVGTGPDYDGYYIGSEGSESDSQFGFGTQESSSLSGFPSGSVAKGGRIVLPPNPDSDSTSSDSLARCGDGFESSEHDRAAPENDDESNTPGYGNSDGYDTECRADYGRVWERYDTSSRGNENPWEPSSQSGNDQTTDTGLWCRDDNEDDNGNDLGLTCTDGTDGSCSDGSSSCGCGSSSGSDGDDATCESANDHSGDESNNYWIIDGDNLVEESCESQGTEQYAYGAAGSDATCTDYSADRNVNGTCVGCVSSGTTTYYGGDSESVSGTNRDWEEVGRTDCSVHNVIDGGNSNPGLYDNSKAGTFTDFTAYEDGSWGSSGRVWCGHDYTTTVDADGPNGYGDGFVVIHQGSIIATENREGNDEVGREVYVDGSNSGYNFENMISASCPNGKNTCIKYANFYTDDSGWSGISNNPGKSEVRDAVEVDTKAVTPDESYSVCKNVNRINEQAGRNSMGDDVIDCDYMRDDDGDNDLENISPLPQACGDESNEHLMMMEGPEVSQGTVDDYLIHEQKCINWDSGQTGNFNRDLGSNSCVLKGKAVSEGTVANVASGTNEAFTESGYEQNADSPDYEVCLDMRDGSPTTSYEDKPLNYRYDDDSQPASESYGGQWYDLDDPRVNEYLRSNSMPSPGLSTSQRSGDTDFIDFYYGENPNPYHADYNPEGGREGTSLLADCGPFVESCADDPDGRQGINADQQTYFAFFQEFVNGGPNRDEDYNPTGENTVTTVTPRFDPMGRINFIKSRSDQLSPGTYDYDEVYDDVRNNDEWWFDTEIDSSSAVQYAYTADYSWSVDSTGVPYPPAGAADTGPYVDDNTGNYYKEDYTGLERTDRSDGSVQKTNKAFGNSLAVVAQQSGITDAEGNSIAQGEGYWIDPDDTRQEWNDGNIQEMNGYSDWRGLVNFKMDLSGPDSGLGWDLESQPGNVQMSSSNEGYVDELKQSNSVAFADIYWQGYEGGNVEPELQEPMCGDDRYEYLLEEKGESPNSVEGSGRYSCTTSPDYCVSFTGGGSPLYEYDPNDITYKQTEEPGETESRLKNDDEACAERPSDVQPNWYDQDFGEVNGNMLCRENSLYGTEGVRWITASQISDNPLAFNDGIDDSWNPRLDQQAFSSLNSDRTGANWDLDGNILDNWTPVDTGTGSNRVADNPNGYGFCGGDDSSEYLIYQDSQAEQVETDQSVIAISSSPDSCVLDNSRLNNIDNSDIDKGRHEGNLDVNNLQDTRMTYSEGESVTFQSSGASRTIQCFDGKWWGEWPIVFYEEVERFNLGETGFIPFMVINPTDSSIEFELDLNPRANNADDRDDLTQITSFESTGSDEMSLTVPGQSSSTQRLEIAANREINTLPEGNDFEIEVIGESTEGSIVGDDQVDLVINESDNTVGSSSNIRDIPGLTFIQMIFIALASTMIFIFRN
jgi:hypothetical protein